MREQGGMRKEEDGGIEGRRKEQKERRKERGERRKEEAYTVGRWSSKRRKQLVREQGGGRRK
jgi:hypothetical protein